MGRKKRTGGFTLLEVLIAMAILGVGIMAILELFPPSLHQALLAVEWGPTMDCADRELGALRARGLGDGRDQLAWPLDPGWTVFTRWGEQHLQYNIQCIGVPDVARQLQGAAQIYHLYRVSMAVPMADGRYESFVTYISKY